MFKNAGEEIRELLERWVIVHLFRISIEIIVAVVFSVLIPSESIPEPGAAQRTNLGQGGTKIE